MPLIQKQCPNGHRAEQYLPTRESFPELRDCQICDAPVFQPVLSLGMPLTWFRESRSPVIANLDPQTPIRSHEHHKRVMKERGVEPLTDWHTSKRRSAM